MNGLLGSGVLTRHVVTECDHGVIVEQRERERGEGGGESSKQDIKVHSHSPNPDRPTWYIVFNVALLLSDTTGVN